MPWQQSEVAVQASAGGKAHYLIGNGIFKAAVLDGAHAPPTQSALVLVLHGPGHALASPLQNKLVRYASSPFTKPRFSLYMAWIRWSLPHCQDLTGPIRTLLAGRPRFQPQ